MALDHGVAAPATAADPLEDFFENGAVGLHLVAADGTILRANKAELQLLGYEPGEYVGRKIAEFHDDLAAIEDILARLSRGETLDKHPARLRAKDGSIKHVLISSSVCFDETGQFRNSRCFTLDVTDRVEAERELAEAQQRLAATYENALAGIAEVDAQGRFLRVNAPFEELTGHARDRLLDLTFFDITHPEDALMERGLYGRQVRGELDRYVVEKRYLCADGRMRWVQVMSSSVRDAQARFLYGVRVVNDISDQRMAAERSSVLINELNHRVKNTLATVQSLALQSARHAMDMDDFMARFEGRLVALSNAHDRLTRHNWEGANLAEIVHGELAMRGGAGRGLTYEGPEVSLAPSVALSLSMAFHELATNAVKYGALSAPEGSVRVSWSVERDPTLQPARVHLQWREQGGPAVAPPTRSGFGTRLLEAMAVELNAEAELDFAPAGVRWRIVFPPATAC